LQPRRAELPVWRFVARIAQRVVGAVLEHAAIVAIDIGLGRRPFGEDDVMRVELDMKVFEPIDLLRLLDRHPIDEMLGRYQYVIEIERVRRRDEEIARRYALRERPRRDT